MSGIHNEFENEDDEWRPEKNKVRRIIEKSVGILFVGTVFALILLMVVRLAMSKPPASMNTMIWTENAVNAYLSEGEDFTVTHFPSTDSFSDDRMFSISQITYTESIGQIQATVRYNARVLNYLREDYGLESLPDGETYVFMLRDNFGNVYKDYHYTSDEKGGYLYRHVIFDGVTMEDVTKLVLEAYYIGDVREQESVRAELYMYRYDYAAQPYAAPMPAEASAELKPRPEYSAEAAE